MAILHLWRTVRRISYVLYLARVPLWGSLFVAGAVSLPAQMPEVMRVLAADVRGSNALFNVWLHALFVGLMAWLTGLANWYWARVTLQAHMPRDWLLQRTVQRTCTWLPRAIGALPWLGLAACGWQARSGLTGVGAQWALGFTVGAVLMAGLLLYVLHLRRRMLEANTQRFGQAWIARTGRISLLGSIVTGALLLLWSTLDAVSMGQLLGAIALVLLSAFVFVPWVAALVHRGTPARVPVMRLLVAWLALISLLDLNDNHAVRTLPGAPQQPLAFDAAVRQWAARQPAGAEQPLPMIFVAAAGGGIRAAYMTAEVLAQLDARLPGFSQHVFAISGVSGGSVGAAVYTSALQHAGEGRIVAAPQAPISAVSGLSGHDCPLCPGSRGTLGADLFGPVVAAMLFRDAVQRFVPVPIPAWDRARAQEEALERAARRAMTNGQPTLLEDAITDLQQQASAVPRPALLLNTTWVEGGSRVAISSVSPPAEALTGLLTLADLAPASHVSLATAAMLSARFTYVSPAGRVGALTDPATGEVRKLRLVDGGYYENSGSATLLDIVRYAAREARNQGLNVLPVVIQIDNDPDTVIANPGERKLRPLPLQPAEPGFGELLSPIRTLLNTRSARGNHALADAEWQVRHGIQDAQGRSVEGVFVYMTLQNRRGAAKLPLGWQLSSIARRDIECQVAPRLAGAAPTASASGAGSGAGTPAALLVSLRLLAADNWGRLPTDAASGINQCVFGHDSMK